MLAQLIVTILRITQVEYSDFSAKNWDEQVQISFHSLIAPAVDSHLSCQTITNRPSIGL